MNKTAYTDHPLSPVSRIVSTEHGIGFWDAERRELRLTFGTHISPSPRIFEEPSDLEVRLFYSIRRETKKRLCAYYNGQGRRTWNGD